MSNPTGLKKIMDFNTAKNEETYEVNGHSYTQKELKLVMSLSKVNSKFNIGRFMLFTLYHTISLSCSYIVAVPLIFIFEKFNLITL